MKETKEILCSTQKTEQKVDQHRKTMSKKLKDQQKAQQNEQQKVQQHYYCELAKYQEQIRKTKESADKDRAA